MGFALLRAIFMKRPNHVIVGHVSWSFFVWAFSKICRYRYSLIIHGIEVFNHNVFREKGLIGARFLWSISSYTQEMVAHKDGYPKEKIILFPPLADEKSFTVPANKRVMREKVGVTHQKLMLTVARLEERERFKGVDVVFQALRQLKRNDFFYIIVGSGNDLIRMQELAKSLGLSGNVKFVGSQDDESLLQFFQAADIYVMPSYEGFGIVYLEALLCGVPVISGNRDGSSEPLQGGKLGFQVDRNIPAEVVRAILEIEKGEDRRCQPEWLRNETIRVFGWEKYIERVKMIRKMSLED
jgi:glycosyltransferase involved in cell wall biosynthesis